jgi:NADPH2:quinone reductase
MAGTPKAGECVLVLGISGKVGQAAAQLARWKGASVVGVLRQDDPSLLAGREIQVINSTTSSIPVWERVNELTGGKGCDIVINTVGEPYYEVGLKSLAQSGRMVFLAERAKKTVTFDIFGFYRKRQSFFGVNTLMLSTVDSCGYLRELLPGFASGSLRAFPISGDATYTLERANEAYTAALAGDKNRLVLKMS